MGKFVKGQSGNAAGKPKGTPNKLSRDMREITWRVFEKLGGEKHLLAFAKDNPEAFHRCYLSKLLPVQITGGDGEPLVIVRDYTGRKDVEPTTIEGEAIPMVTFTDRPH